jgi:hypothetical protein
VQACCPLFFRAANGVVDAFGVLGLAFVSLLTANVLLPCIVVLRNARCRRSACPRSPAVIEAG